MTCRNQLMNEGKPYPRSSCTLCGTLLGGKRICKMGVEPNPPQGSSLGPQHYVDTENPVTEFKYAALTVTSIHHEGDERSRTHPGHGYPAYTEKVDSIRKFKDIEQMKDWVRQRDKYERYTLIKYQELSVETEIVVKVK